MKPAIQKHRPLVILAAILLLAVFVRVWAIDYGLPYEGITYDQVTFEESQEVLRAFKLGAGEYAWKFGKGGLYYILFVEYGVYYVVSLATGSVDNPRDFALQIVENRTPAYVIGRLTVALMGVLTCFVVYRFGTMLHDQRVGLGAAFLGATAYFHAVFSSVINVDIGMTLALWSSLLFYLMYERVHSRRYLILAGILGGVAIAFKLPGGVIIPLIFVAIFTASQAAATFATRTKEFALFFASLIVTLTIVAPEWTSGLADLQRNFAGLLGGDSKTPSAQTEFSETAKVVSAFGGRQWGYLRHLTRDYNLLLTLGALAGFALALYRRHRWDLILAGFVIVFVFVMSLADRTQAERYLLPIMPAAWLLASSAVFYLAGSRKIVAVAALLVMTVMPSIHLLQSAAERLQPDTRITAKEWIEANVPAGSKILMDGMRYRFIPSPPLNPSRESLSNKVTKASEEGEDISRGVSDLTLSVYEEAMDRVQGPRYELTSTEHGLKVQPASHYIDSCYDYVVTSSLITERFRPGSRSSQIAPQAAEFYGSLATDPRFNLVYSVATRPWVRRGPEINVYEITSECAPG